MSIRSQPVARRLGPLCLILIAGLTVLAPAARAQQRPQVTITFMDVGQGDAALIRSPSGRTVLVDAGPSPRGVADWLRARKVDSLNLAIASHNHADHIGGMLAVLSDIRVQYYMENGMAATTQSYARIVRLLEQREIPVLRAVRRSIDMGDAVIIRVKPGAADARAQNDASIGLELEYGKFRAFFTGDAEDRTRALWIRDSVPHLQVLKVSHHGSENGTDAAMLKRFTPCAAIISVGARNSFGHPSPRVLRLLDSARAVTYRTDRSGDITITADTSGTFTVTTGRPARSVTYGATCQRTR